LTDPFGKDYEIGYSMLKPDLTATFGKMMSIAQESSIAHTNATSFPMRWFAEHKMGWLIIGGRAVAYRYPKYGDVVTAETHLCGVRGMTADRNFIICDKNGQCLLKAVTTWVYADLDSRRPARPDAGMPEGYGAIRPPCLETDYGLPNASSPLVSSYSLTVARRDTDTNLHVNNVKYIEWAEDGVPDAVYLRGAVREARMRYKRECGNGDVVRVDTAAAGEAAFLSRIIKLSGDGEILLAEIYTAWE
jgi:medium-chain acyl-[acyl-carrier-protein] hydrolase